LETGLLKVVWAPILAGLVVLALGMALSLSATRWLSARVVRLQGGHSVLGFAALLILAVLLLLVWQPLMLLAKMYSQSIAVALVGYVSFPGSGFSDAIFDNVNRFGRQAISPDPMSAAVRMHHQALGLLTKARAAGIDWYFEIYGAMPRAWYLADVFAGTIRIVFSAFFLGCFVLRRLVHRPLVNLGLNWLTSGKPIFASLFGGIGAVVVFGSELIKALG
jgi:hypothetical protein